MEEGVAPRSEEGLEDAVGRQGRGDRQITSGESLAHAHQVRSDRLVRVLAGEERAGLAEAGRHLVDDEQDLVAIAERAQRAQVTPRCGLNTAGAFDGLDDGRGDLVSALGEDRLDLAQARLHAGVGVGTAAGMVVPVRIGGTGLLGQEVQEGPVEHRIGSDTHRSHGVAVVVVRETQDLVLPRSVLVGEPLDRRLERDLHRRGPAVGEEDALESCGSDLHELLGQQGRRHVALAEQGAVRDEVELLPDCGVQRRMTVPVDVEPDGAGAVEVPAPVHVLQAEALGAGDQHGIALDIRGHRGEGMPDVGFVPGGDLVGGGLVGRSHGGPREQSRRVVAQRATPRSR